MLQPGSLVRHQGIGSRVRLVKAVIGKFFHQVKNGFGLLGINIVLCSTLQENLALFLHFFRLFLAHGTAQHVRTAKRVIGKHLGNLHYLLLVQNDPVSILQHRFEMRMRIGHIHFSVLAIDEIVHHARAERTGTKQCYECNDVFKVARPQALDQVLHAARFKLEDSRCFTLLQHFEHTRIIERDIIDVQSVSRGRVIDHAHGPVNDGQGSQAQEVKLDQPGALYIVLIKLRDQVIAVFIAIQW